ncbi:MAG TPA: MarR family transcriptional regulator [Candidatus Dormibacteraeota bacterium]|nr:MarR family transcriptional regulator [Candidatus Dormibacteraeota bacterium]
MIKATRTILKRDPALEPLMQAFRRFRSQAFGGAMNLEFFVRNNLTIAQLRAMFAIGQTGRLSGRQLARELHISPAAVVPLCDRLERDGYVSRVPDTVDRRITWFELTDAGKKALEEVSWASPSRMMRALAHLEMHDREALIRILDKLADELESSDERPRRAEVPRKQLA